MEKDIHDKKWYKNRINELEDWLFDKKICNADNPIEKEAYECVLRKVIDMLDIMDDEDAENLLRSLDEWEKWE